MHDEGQKAYAVKFKMAAHAYKGAIRVYDDGQASIHRNLVREDRPVLVEVEGKEPTDKQLATVKMIWTLLSDSFNFSIVDFCPVLLRHQMEIMAAQMVIYEFVRPKAQEGADT